MPYAHMGTVPRGSTLTSARKWALWAHGRVEEHRRSGHVPVEEPVANSSAWGFRSDHLIGVMPTVICFMWPNCWAFIWTWSPLTGGSKYPNAMWRSPSSPRYLSTERTRGTTWTQCVTTISPSKKSQLDWYLHEGHLSDKAIDHFLLKPVHLVREMRLVMR